MRILIFEETPAEDSTYLHEILPREAEIESRKAFADDRKITWTRNELELLLGPAPVRNSNQHVVAEAVMDVVRVLIGSELNSEMAAQAVPTIVGVLHGLPLTLLTGAADEWEAIGEPNVSYLDENDEEVAEEIKDSAYKVVRASVYQNKRLTRVIRSEVLTSIIGNLVTEEIVHYAMDAVTFRTSDGSMFRGRGSRRRVEFPYSPPRDPVIVDVLDQNDPAVNHDWVHQPEGPSQEEIRAYRISPASQELDRLEFIQDWTRNDSLTFDLFSMAGNIRVTWPGKYGPENEARRGTVLFAGDPPISEKTGKPLPELTTEDIAARSDEEIIAAEWYAGRLSLNASDNDHIIVPEPPEWLRPFMEDLTDQES